MMALKRTAVAFAWISLAATAASAADYVADTLRETNAVLFSEMVLQRAASDIARMPEGELHAFTRYLSVCKLLGNFGDDPACSEVQTSYSIEFGARRSLDDLLRSMISRDSLDRFRVGHGEKGIFDSDWIIRESIITVTLQEAARARFRALRASKTIP